MWFEIGVNFAVEDQVLIGFWRECHKLHLTYISIISKLILTNQVLLQRPKWEIFIYLKDVQKCQQITEISDYQ